MRTRKNATQDELDAIPGHLEITREEAWMIMAHRRGVLFSEIRELPTEEEIEEAREWNRKYLGLPKPDLPAGPLDIEREVQLDTDDGQETGNIDFYARIDGRRVTGVCLGPVNVNGTRVIYALNGESAGGIDPDGFLSAQQAFALGLVLQRAALELDPGLDRHLLEERAIA